VAFAKKRSHVKIGTPNRGFQAIDEIYFIISSEFNGIAPVKPTAALCGISAKNAEGRDIREYPRPTVVSN
jgi:hypothetical protein